MIKSLEFTLEAFWRFFQAYALDRGLHSNSPKQAMEVAFQLGLIFPEDEMAWIDMVDDRNKTSHIYHRSLAEEIFKRIAEKYRGAFDRSMKKVDAMK